MTTRTLHRDEWPRLIGTELEQVWPVLPMDAQILVVEHLGAIVGCWAVIRYVHVEGLWIADAYRKRASVGRRLLAGMARLAQSLGVQSVWTAAATEDVAQLITRAGGVKLPFDHYVFPVGGK